MQESFDKWTAKAIDILADRYTEGYMSKRAIWLKFLSHAVTLLSCNQLQVEESFTVTRAVQSHAVLMDGHARDGQICPLCTVKLCLRVSRSLYCHGDYLFAGQLAQQGLLKGQRALEDGHRLIRQILDIKACISMILEDFSGATNLLHQAINVGLVNLNPLDEEILYYKRLLTISLTGEGLLRLALKDKKKTFETCVEILGQDSQRTLFIMSALARSYAQADCTKEAYDLAVKAMRSYAEVQNNFSFEM